MSEQERAWLNRAVRYGGSFIATFAQACFYADDENFELLRPVLVKMMEKYPKYSDEAMWRTIEAEARSRQ